MRGTVSIISLVDFDFRRDSFDLLFQSKSTNFNRQKEEHHNWTKKVNQKEESNVVNVVVVSASR